MREPRKAERATDNRLSRSFFNRAEKKATVPKNILMQRVITVLFAIILFAHYAWGYVESSVHISVTVPSTTKLELPDPAKGYIDYSKWTCDNANITMSTMVGVAWITINKSFTGEAQVQCLYVAKWYDDRGFTQSTTYLRTFYISCNSTGSDPNNTISIKPNGGEINRGTLISISSSNKNAKIYYTTDGTVPTSQSKKYTSELVYNGFQTLKAISILSDGTTSSIAYADFSIKTSNLVNFQSLEGVSIVGTIEGKDIYLGEGPYYPCIDENYRGNLTIPESIESRIISGASKHAFYGCKLEKVVLPEKLAYISSEAFYLATIKTLFLKCPDNVTIKSEAFLLDNVNELYSFSSNPINIANQAFSSTTYKYCTLYVPIGTRALYRSKKGWENFSKIVEFDPSEFSSITPIVDTLTNEGEEYYSLQGIKVDKPDKGLYIRVKNGVKEKVLIK